jgi:hypothetical protein
MDRRNNATLWPRRCALFSAKGAGSCKPPSDRLKAAHFFVAVKGSFGKLNGVSLEQLESAILGLAPEERKRLAAWFEENRRELLGDDGDELSEQQEAEILRRRDQALAHPELLEPWDGAIERVRQRLHEFRDQETSSRDKLELWYDGKHESRSA